MATRTIRFMSAAIRTARRAKQWALVAAREADRLLQEARTRVESDARRRRPKQTLQKAGRALMMAGRAALVAAVAAGIAEARAERSRRRLRQASAPTAPASPPI